MRLPLVIFSLLLSSLAYSQDANNYIQVITNTSLNFALNSVSKIESDQTTNNALTLQLTTKDKNRDVNARISAVTGPTGYTLTSPYPVKLLLSSTTSSTTNNLVTSALQLTSADQRLFTQRKINSTVQFNYNLIFMATNWDYPPGNYSFTILFTLTPP